MVSLVGDKPPHIEDNLLAGVGGTNRLYFICEPGVRIYAYGEEIYLMLYLSEEGRLRDIHRGCPEDEIGTTYQPPLQGQEEPQEVLLLEDIAVPV